LTRIRWWTFSWATGVGILPFTVLMAVMGNYAEVLTWEAWVLLIVAVPAVCFLFRNRFRPMQRERDRRGADRAGEK